MPSSSSIGAIAVSPLSLVGFGLSRLVDGTAKSFIYRGRVIKYHLLITILKVPPVIVTVPTLWNMLVMEACDGVGSVVGCLHWLS